MTFIKFKGCTALEEVIIPSSVVKISSDAFKECPNLRNSNISPSIEDAIDEENIPPSTEDSIDGVIFDDVD